MQFLITQDVRQQVQEIVTVDYKAEDKPTEKLQQVMQQAGVDEQTLVTLVTESVIRHIGSEAAKNGGSE